MVRINPLREKKEISLVYRTGRKIESGSFRLFAKQNALKKIRLTVVVPRSVSKRATKRNLLRRRAREWIRTKLQNCFSGSDFILFIKKEATSIPRTQFYKELYTIFSHAERKQ